ncbi:hypothetical protein RJ55_00165 [Drechmeria coniospora]|nr:hypothetical protein RJ55_00165 [Drechmeria coniospora]
MSEPNTANLRLVDLEIVGPVTQRAMTRLNRPMQPKLDALLHRIIASHAAAHRDAPAVDAWDGMLTYAELDSESSHLADYLVQLGVGPEVFVPIIFEKSKLAIVSMLAVAKAGGAIVPLDSRAPLSRLHAMVADVKAPLAISSALNQGKLAPVVREVVLNERLLSRLASKPPGHFDTLPNTVNADNALYVMFTSGSTGKPKGVVVSHASFCSSSAGLLDPLYLSTPNRRSLHFASPAFDASVMEIFMTLMAGGCICIPSESDRLDNIAKCMVELNVNWAFLTPTVAKLIRPEDVPQLEVLCCGGEALSRDVVDIWADHAKLVNVYGPTEASVAAVTSDPISRGRQEIPLGRPRNCAVWILNEQGDRIQPFNTVGEIVIEGPGVARGYLGNEAKTAAVFGDNASFLQMIAGGSSRFYKTGDLGRMNLDGTLEFLGRKDSQVKINGQRIELGEIEQQAKAVLGEHGKGFEFDLVVEPIQPSNRGTTVIAAFVGTAEVATKEVILDRQHPASLRILARTMDIKEKMTSVVPEYMIPSVVFPCGALPRTTSGKTDRKALRQAGNSLSISELRSFQTLTSNSTDLVKDFKVNHTSKTPSSVSSYTTDDGQDGTGTPSTSAESAECSSHSTCLTADERLLRKVWADVLELPESTILLHDEFFKLGGDSIGLIKVVAACRGAGVHVSVASIAASAILRDMATVLQKSRSDENSTTVEKIEPFSLVEGTISLLRQEVAFQCSVEPAMVEDIYPCTQMQEDMVIANTIHAGVCVGRFIHKLPSNVDIARLKKTWVAVWKGSSILRTRFARTTTAGSIQVVIKEEMPWSVSQDLKAYLRDDQAEPMHPGSPFNRFAVAVDNDKTMYFVWTMHHMLYDAWSVQLICNRVNTLYQGNPVEPVADFRTFIAHTRNLDQGRTTRYWRETMDGVAPSTFPAPANLEHTSLARASIKDHLDLPTRCELLQTSGLTMSTIVQAAWAIMIGRYSKTDDVLFGATISGRNASVGCIENMDGPTLATVPIRLKLAAETRATDFLHKVQDYLTGLIPYEQTGLKAIRAINEHTKRGCDFQNMLVIQSEAVWSEQASPLGKPAHRGEDATVPLLCQVWLGLEQMELDVVFDDSVVGREVVVDAMSMFKEAIGQLLQLSESSSTRLADLELAKRFSQAAVCASEFGGVEVDEAVVAVEATIHDLIATITRQQGPEEALCSSEMSLSYDALNRLSTRLAAHLISLGVGKGEIVPLCFEKSVWTVVSMLATLKSGAAFVLLDPTQPLQRLQDLLAQVEPHYILTSCLQDKKREFGMSLRRVVVDGTFIGNLPETPSNQLPRVSPSDLAYMIFTSGSTGQPKGVMISHSALASSAAAYGEALKLVPRKRVLQFSSYTFDASLNETLVVLLRGGTICVASDEERMEDLSGFMRRAKVDWAILTPSVARLLSPIDVQCLETLDLGGEAPDTVLLSKWHQSGVRVFNVYGPAEGAGTVLCQRYSEGLDPRTVGFPMGCQAWLVDADDHDRIVPDGETGELLLEGPILASGYFKDQRKTDLSFITDPKWAKPLRNSPSPRRMYKTGDLCFRNSSGAIIYVGRKDLQVKLHGQRVELGDIESHVATCNGIAGCAIFYPVDGPFKKQLTAVVELSIECMDSESIRSRMETELASKLPSSMIPTRWLKVTDLFGKGSPMPLNSSGKVDRRLITARLQESSAAEAEILDPNETLSEPAKAIKIQNSEQPAFALAGMIHSMLPARQGSGGRLNDDRSFDDLVLQSSGLDSLNMMSLMFFISKQFQVQVPMQFLMHKDTSIRKVASFVSEAQSQSSKPPAHTDTTSSSDRVSVDIMAEIRRHDAKIAFIQQATSESVDVDGRIEPNPKHQMTVLLTGASGYIGTQILRQLLEHRLVGRVISIVRAESDAAARKRTIDSAEKADWWTNFHGEKLEVWPGDLSLPHLGLDKTRWGYLESGEIDIIIHNGAAVHWSKSFSALEAANVSSTMELLAVAVASKHVRFAYISGGRERGPSEELEEDVARELSAPDAVGYSQTKFVSEAVVRRAAQRCASFPGPNRFSIVIPGLVIGTPTEGVANIDDYIWRLAATCIRVGAYNASQADAWVCLSDATTMAATIIGAVFDKRSQKGPAGIVTEVTDGMTWGELWAILERMGYRLEGRDAQDWLAAVRGDLDISRESHPLWPLAHMLDNQEAQDEEQGTESERGETPLKLRVAVVKSAEFLAKVGFLPGPGNVATGAGMMTMGGGFRRSGL